MEYPIINNISDVLPSIEGKDYIIVVEKDGYTAIDYVYTDNDSFSTPIERECRGLLFNTEGTLIRRAFHKFYNFGERQEVFSTIADDIDQLLFLEKLDGSMVTPFLVYGNLRLATRMGITQQAMAAETFIADKPLYTEMMRYCLDRGVTPIFEWLDANNPIVVTYEGDDLVLLAMRDMVTGAYIDRDEVMRIANTYGIPIARAYKSKEVEALVKEIEDTEGEEGMVAYGPKGLIKIKSQWYLRLHRIKDVTRKPRNLIKAILTGDIDDILPIMDLPSQEYVTSFRAHLNASMGILQRDIIAGFESYQIAHEYDRKDFAINSKLPPYIKRAVFSMIDGSTSLECMLDLVNKGIRTDTTFETFNDILKLEV